MLIQGETVARDIWTAVYNVVEAWNEVYCETDNVIAEINRVLPTSIVDGNPHFEAIEALNFVEALRHDLAHYRDGGYESDNVPFNDNKAIEIYDDNVEECDEAYKWADGWPSLVEMAEDADTFYELECAYKANASRYYCETRQRELISSIIEALEEIDYDD